VLSKIVSQSETLHAALMRHELMSYALTQQIAACNARHELDERLCRWLMQTRDLLECDTLPLTEEFLAQMLGVQRSSVTMIARKLQESGLIRHRRGHIEVLDPVHLQDASCECYETINHHFERLVGWRPIHPIGPGPRCPSRRSTPRAIASQQRPGLVHPGARRSR